MDQKMPRTTGEKAKDKMDEMNLKAKAKTKELSNDAKKSYEDTKKNFDHKMH